MASHSDDGGQSVANDESDRERVTLAARENRAVAWMRGLVFVALLAITTGVSSRVYLYTRNEQIKDFEQAFAADADKLLESFQHSVERRIEAIDSMSVAITSFATATGATFPNVTLPDFGVRCSNSRILSSSVFVQYQPLVSEEQRLGWEAYQIANRGHHDAALQTELALLKEQDARVQEQSMHGRTLQSSTTERLRDTIENLTPNGTSVVAPYGSGPYLPMWQSSPVIPQNKALLNFNALSHPAAAGGYREAIQSGQAVIEAASNLAGENFGRTGLFFKAMLSMSQYRNDVEDYLGEPVSTFAYPVFDSFNRSSRQVVAVIGTSLYWQLYFKNVLSRSARGIACVLKNTRNQTFSYRIDKDTVEYLGIGDYHDPQYNHLVQESDVGYYIAKQSSTETKSFTSVELNTAYCSYKLSVYPSKATERHYVNGDPLYLTVVVVSIFLFTSLVFLLFMVAVNRRQRVVMDRAVASSAIVSSLFPMQIRDQIYQEQKAEKKKSWHTADWNEHKSEANAMKPQGFEKSTVTTRPIAKLFESTTVMFADIAGFTSWSSTRSPVQVFELLETLYQAFDGIAVRRKVFKVETIGDCYVAVAGLPDPQDDHAVIMTRFAMDCISSMNQLTAALVHILGEDTSSLELRVGLHSGSVTGGVL
jgi:Adenylate and Guanylate cyclase catalytic domain